MVKQTTKTTAKKTAPKTGSKIAKAKQSTIDPDFQPNKMGFAVASLAAVSLVLLGTIAMYG